jgi:HAD superfamily phosphatase (TIGR01668 family)
MSLSLVPDRLYAAYTDITPQMLQSWGIRLLLCDLDYTLAPRSVSHPDEKVLAWVNSMKAAGIEVMILSNNRSSERVELFCKDMGITYVGHAGKPAKRGYREAMVKAGVTEKETAMLGDKLLTDVLGAKRSNVLALMVEPLGGPVGAWNHVLHALQAPFKAMTKENYL